MPTPTAPDLQLTKTDRTIKHRGRWLAIHTTTHPEARSPWVVETASHRLYTLMRHHKTPTLLYGWRLDDDSATRLPGFFSDASGELKSLG